MDPREWSAALTASLEHVHLRRLLEVRSVRVTPGGYRVILHHHELTHRLLMQELLDRPEVSRVLDGWDIANGPLSICFMHAGDDARDAEEMITIDSRGVFTLDPMRSRQRLDYLTDEGPLAWFKRTVSGDLPFRLPSGMLRCDARAWETPGAVDAFGELPIIPVVLDNPGDLTIFGHFGHGVSSYAIYHIASEGPHYTFLRLHFGGAYGSIDQDRRYVLAYLRGFGRFRERWRPLLRQSTLVHNMGTTTLRVVFRGSGVGATSVTEVPFSTWKDVDEFLEPRIGRQVKGQ
jgi:hypothetical protein